MCLLTPLFLWKANIAPNFLGPLEAWNYHRCWTTIKEFCLKTKQICLKSLLHQVSRRRTSGRDCPEGMVLHHRALGHSTAACLSCPWQDRRNLVEIKASLVQRSSVKLEFIVVAKQKLHLFAITLDCYILGWPPGEVAGHLPALECENICVFKDWNHTQVCHAGDNCRFMSLISGYSGGALTVWNGFV